MTRREPGANTAAAAADRRAEPNCPHFNPFSREREKVAAKRPDEGEARKLQSANAMPPRAATPRNLAAGPDLASFAGRRVTRQDKAIC
jgi:hypothetical protein